MLGFKKNISICSAIHIVKGFIRMTGNSSKKHIPNHIVDFSYLKFFLYHHASSERDLSYLGYLEILSYQLGEGQHRWCY